MSLEDDLPGVDRVHGPESTKRRIVQSAVQSDEPHAQLEDLGIDAGEARDILGLEDDFPI